MSNCISIRDREVKFSPAEMDVEAFLAMINKHSGCRSDAKKNTVKCGVHDDSLEADPVERVCQKLDRKPKYGDWEFHGEEDLRCYYVHWFLNGHNVYKEDDSVVIIFGGGPSGHTWRDFRGTCSVINGFMRQPKTHRFLIEDDGFPGWEYNKVEFKPEPADQ